MSLFFPKITKKVINQILLNICLEKIVYLTSGHKTFSGRNVIQQHLEILQQVSRFYIPVIYKVIIDKRDI